MAIDSRVTITAKTGNNETVPGTQLLNVAKLTLDLVRQLAKLEMGYIGGWGGGNQPNVAQYPEYDISGITTVTVTITKNAINNIYQFTLS